MLRILHVLSKHLATSSVRQVAALSQELHARGHAVQICSLASDSREQRHVDFHLQASREDSLDLTFCPQLLHYDPAFVRRFGHVLHEATPDVIHYWGASVNAPVWMANRLHGNRAMVASIDQPRPNFCDWLLPNLCFVASHPDDRETSFSSTVRQTTVIRPAVVARDSACAKETTLPSLHSELGVSPQTRFIVAISDLVRQSRCRDLIWALDLLRVLHDDVQLVILGEGTEKTKLVDFAELATTHDGVVHFLERREYEQENRLLSQAVAFWQAGVAANAASMLQAMSCRLPIVAADSLSSRDVVESNESGFLVPMGDSAEFARKTNFLLADPGMADRMGRTAERRSQDFSLASMVEAFAGVYEQARSITWKKQVA